MLADIQALKEVLPKALAKRATEAQAEQAAGEDNAEHPDLHAEQQVEYRRRFGKWTTDVLHLLTEDEGILWTVVDVAYRVHEVTNLMFVEANKHNAVFCTSGRVMMGGKLSLMFALATGLAQTLSARLDNLLSDFATWARVTEAAPREFRGRLHELIVLLTLNYAAAFHRRIGAPVARPASA